MPICSDLICVKIDPKFFGKIALLHILSRKTCPEKKEARYVRVAIPVIKKTNAFLVRYRSQLRF